MITKLHIIINLCANAQNIKKLILIYYRNDNLFAQHISLHEAHNVSKWVCCSSLHIWDQTSLGEGPQSQYPISNHSDSDTLRYYHEMASTDTHVQKHLFLKHE